MTVLFCPLMTSIELAEVRHSARIAQQTHIVWVIKTNLLMLCAEIIVDYFEIRAKYRNTRLFEMIVGVLTTFPDATACDFFLWGYVKDISQSVHI